MELKLTSDDPRLIEYMLLIAPLMELKRWCLYPRSQASNGF